jgi:hypothetical protein
MFRYVQKNVQISTPFTVKIDGSQYQDICENVHYKILVVRLITVDAPPTGVA